MNNSKGVILKSVVNNRFVRYNETVEFRGIVTVI